MATCFMLDSYSLTNNPAQTKTRQPKVWLAERAVFSWWPEANTRNAQAERQISICVMVGLAAGIKRF